MKFTSSPLAAGMLLFFAGSASAADLSYSASVSYGATPSGIVLSHPNTLSGTFDFSNDPDYTPGAQFRDAQVTFTFSDGLPSSESLSVYLGQSTVPFITSGSIPGGKYTVLGGALDAAAAADLFKDGKLSFIIRADSGSFNVVNAFLSAEGVSSSGSSSGVPDGGSTLAMGAMSLLGLAAVKRRLSIRRRAEALFSCCNE